MCSDLDVDFSNDVIDTATVIEDDMDTTNEISLDMDDSIFEDKSELFDISDSEFEPNNEDFTENDLLDISDSDISTDDNSFNDNQFDIYELTENIENDNFDWFSDSMDTLNGSDLFELSEPENKTLNTSPIDNYEQEQLLDKELEEVFNNKMNTENVNDDSGELKCDLTDEINSYEDILNDFNDIDNINNADNFDSSNDVVDNIIEKNTGENLSEGLINDWRIDDIDIIDGSGQPSQIKMETEFLKEKYAEAIENSDQEQADRYRALYELNTLKDDLNLTEGDSNISQLGGLHKNVQGKLEGFESHHIPAQSVQDVNARNLPSIALTKEDHSLTNSYRWKSNQKHDSFIPDILNNNGTYKEEAEKMIDNGNYTDLIRDEIYNIRDACGNKYDGAIKQYLNEVANMIATKGIPKSK